MSRTRRRGDETGYDERGKHTFHRHEGELIRAWLWATLKKAERELASAERLLEKRVTPYTQERYGRAVVVLSWLQGMYRAGTQSIDTLDWAEAWVHVTTTERHGGADAKHRGEQQTIPGM